MPHRRTHRVPSVSTNEQDRGQLIPRATPVDTFVQPVAPRVPRTNTLLQLANALSDISPKLAAMQKRAEEEATKEGEIRQKEAGIDWDQAVKQGVVPPGLSPNVRKGWKRSELRNKGFQFMEQLAREYETTGLAESGDAGEFAAWKAQKVAEFMQSNQIRQSYSTDIIEDALLPILNQTEQQIQAKHVQGVTKAVEEGIFREFSDEVDNVINFQASQGTPDQTAEETGRYLSEIARSHIGRGLSGNAINKALVDNIVTKATAEGDTDVLDILDHIRTGTGSLGRTLYARQQREKAEDEIVAEGQRAERFQAWQVDEQRQEIRRQAMSASFQAFIENPYTDVSAVLGPLAQVDPQAAQDMIALQEKMQKRRSNPVVRPEVTTELYLDLMTESDPVKRLERIRRFGLSGEGGPSDVTNAFRFNNRIVERGGPLHEREFRDLSRDLRKVIGGNEFESTPIQAFLANKADLEMRTRAMLWIEDNSDDQGNFPRTEFFNFLYKEFDRIVADPRFQAEVAGQLEQGNPLDPANTRTIITNPDDILNDPSLAQ